MGARRKFWLLDDRSWFWNGSDSGGPPGFILVMMLLALLGCVASVVLAAMGF